jgi:hypothetical protein
MTKKEKYERLADKIYELVTEAEPTFGDAIAALELSKLWIYSDFADLHEQNKTVDSIELPDDEADEK